MEYHVMMTLDGTIIPSSTICCGNLDKCQTALNHLYGLTSRAENVGFVVVPCVDYHSVERALI